VNAYRAAGLEDRAAELELEILQRALEAEMRMLERAEREGAYQQALERARGLADRYPAYKDWAPDLERLALKTQLKDLYQRGLGAVQSGDQQMAQSLLAQVVSLEPGYQEASRFLHLAVTGVDPTGLQTQLETAQASAAEKTHDRWWWRINTLLVFLGGLDLTFLIGAAAALVFLVVTGSESEPTFCASIFWLAGLVASIWWAVVWRDK
jgi:hypothetical protein